MKRLLMVLALILAAATMMAPIPASAVQYNTLASWQVAAGSYANVSLPASNLIAYRTDFLPSGGGDFFNMDVALTYSSGFYYTPIDDFHTNLAFYPAGVSGSIAEFGFEVVPFDVGSILSIQVYTAAAGSHTYNFTAENTAPMFFGWVGDPVITVSTWSSERYGLGNFVEGTTAPIPEPSMMLLVGSGMAGLVGYGRRRFKK